MKVSIIIPTHNRVDSLLQTIKSLFNLDYSKKDYEIIIVDNASSDNTQLAVTKLAREKKINNLKLIKEESLGLHYARHTGAKISKGELLIFTDDDAIVDKQLLKVYVDAFLKHPKMVAAGGPVKPFWENKPPQWLIDYIGDKKVFYLLSLMDLGNKFILDKERFFFGVNMAIRRKILFEVGGFNPCLIGDVYVGNGESGLNQKLWQKGMLIGYIPEAVVYHHIPPERMTATYFKHRMANEGASGMYEKYHNHIPCKTWLIFEICKLFTINIGWFLGGLLLNGRTDKYSLNIQMESARIRSQIKYIFNLIKDDKFRRLVLKRDWLN